MPAGNPSKLNIALLQGAAKNAGDYLIVERSKAIIWDALGRSTCNIKKFKRTVPLYRYLDAFNACDLAIFAGGPGFGKEMYPGAFPLTESLDELKPPLVYLGGGVGLKSQKSTSIDFTASSRQLLARLDNDGLGVSARDVFSARILQNSGVPNVVMTGCPAWYDLEMLDELAPILAERGNIRSIAISDAAFARDFHLVKRIVGLMPSLFGNAQIRYVFHRGLGSDKNEEYNAKQHELAAWLEAAGVEIDDISYSAEGLSLYDEVDLHIGFRVHAHIYSLSRRKASILLEEDARGYGVNETLGLTHLAAPKPMGKGEFTQSVNDAQATSPVRTAMFMRKVKQLLVSETEGDYPEARHAFHVMHDTYPVMRQFIQDAVGKLTRGTTGTGTTVSTRN